jgi:hypothetical protein
MTTEDRDRQILFLIKNTREEYHRCSFRSRGYALHKGEYDALYGSGDHCEEVRETFCPGYAEPRSL